MLAALQGTSTHAASGSLSLAWDPSPGPDVAGYVVRWGERSGAHTQETDVGDVTSFTISALEDGQRYYVVVQAYDPGKKRSALSNEASGIAAPGTAAPPAPAPEPAPSQPEPAPVPGCTNPSSGCDEAPSGSAPGGGISNGPGSGNRIVSNQKPGLGAQNDFDADAKDDFAVYHPARGQWHVRGSSGLELYVEEFENRSLEIVPVSADFDGDGAEDIASWRPSDGLWVLYTSGNDFRRTGEARLGSPLGIPVPADYDGDGTADIAVFEPDGYWRSLSGALQFGRQPGDIPVPSDYDGDDVADIAIYRPSSGAWHIAGGPVVHFGSDGDVPVPADYDGDGSIDIAVYRPSTSTWYIRGQYRTTFGQLGDIPITLDTDGDGRVELVLYRPSEGAWLVFNPERRAADKIFFGGPGAVPIGAPPSFLAHPAAFPSLSY